MSSPFKYKTIFENEIIASSSIEDSGLDISNASLEDLSSLIPEDVDLDKNIDLLGVAFNGAVANKFNRNDDGIGTSTALAIKDYFVHKPTNIEHRKEKVVGHIVSSGFSEFGSNQMLGEDDVKDLIGPFNIALGAVIYKTVNREFAELVKSSTIEGSKFHNMVSASWEIGFNEYALAIGGSDLNDAEIVTDKKQIEELKKYLKAFDGNGTMKDGTRIYRLVTGSVFPLGIGFTSNPAAEVKGIYVEEEVKKKERKEGENNEDEVEAIHIETENFLKKLKKYKKNFSQREETNVNLDSHLNSKPKMDMKDLVEQLTETIQANASGKFSEEAVANIIKSVSDAIRDRSDQYAEEKIQIEQEKAELAKAESESKEKVDQLEKELASSNEKLSELETSQKASEALQLFNARMESLDSQYDFSDEDRKIVAQDLKGVDATDESYASYEERVSVIYKHKSKEFLAEQEKAFAEKVEVEVQKKIASLSPTEVVEASEEEVEKATEEALENVEASEAELPSNNGESSEKELTLADKFKAAFNKDTVSIQY